MQLKLKNINATINVLDSSTAINIKAECSSVEEADAIRASLTKGSLSDFQFISDSGEVAGRYYNHILEKTEYMVEDGVYHVSYTTRQLTDTEIRLDALEEGQDLQDGAIEELAGIVGGGE